MRTITATLEVARQTLLQLCRHRLLLLVGVGVCGIPLLLWSLAWLHRLPSRMHAGWAFVSVATVFHIYMLLPWTAMFLAVQAVHGDIEDRTFQYLFLRPVPRAALLLGKWLAAWILTALVLLAGIALLFAAVQATGLAWPEDLDPWPALGSYLIAVAGGAAAYTAVAALLAARFRRPMVWAAAYIAGLEYFAANLPAEAGVRSLAVTDALRRFLIDGLEVRGRLLHTLWPGGGWRADFVGHPERQLLWTGLGCVLLAMLVYHRSEYDSRPRE